MITQVSWSPKIKLLATVVLYYFSRAKFPWPEIKPGTRQGKSWILATRPTTQDVLGCPTPCQKAPHGYMFGCLLFIVFLSLFWHAVDFTSSILYLDIYSFCNCQYVYSIGAPLLPLSQVLIYMLFSTVQRAFTYLISSNLICYF